MKKAIEEVIKDDFSIKKVCWCLTIPAIWKDIENFLMIVAAKNAGLIDSTSPNEYDFKLIFEPEAASSFCMIVPHSFYKTFKSFI
jgi:hypothetical protein